jgi:hypothetical protein
MHDCTITEMILFQMKWKMVLICWIYKLLFENDASPSKPVLYAILKDEL